MFVSVLLPLALPGSFTYILPPTLAGRVTVGTRVIVQFGARRYYTALVIALHEENPQPGVKLKEVTDLVDAQPIVLPKQLELWKWMAQYYMCTAGELMKAALPSGLKLESETLLARNEEYDCDTQPLTERETQIYHALTADKGTKLQALEKELGTGSLLQTVKHLVDIGAVTVRESLTQGFKPRKQQYVRLTATCQTETSLHLLLDRLRQAPRQEALLLRYLELSKAAAALTLHNPQLIKEVARAELCEETQDTAALAALRKRGVLEIYEVETQRLKTFSAEALVARKRLAARQQQAHDDIVNHFKEKEVCLLHGVTSSGKTEVYIALIEEMLAQGKQVLYLVPEIALTTQLTTRLGRVFGSRMGVYHSKFPDAERVELWQHQLSDHPFPLILGVRSSIFLPFQNLGLVIVDEEHETSYKQQDPAPRYNGRDTALVLARQQGAKVLLGTATPSLESYHHAQTGKYALVEMLTRYGEVEMPEIVVEDVKELRRKRLMKSPFSPHLTERVRAALANHEQAILFQNRRGYAPVLECRTCGWTPRCTRCDVSLTYHQRMNKLVCHYCGTAYDVPRQCPNCGDTELRDIGYGTEKIEAEARTVFPEAHTERMDLDTTRSRTAYEEIIRRFQQGETNLLIGTQMVTKGLDFDHVSVVGILHADQMLNIPDFRAYERAYQMMSQVAGRAGRRGKRGLVILQTRQPDTPVISQIVRGDYLSMYREQMEERTLFHFPPAYRLIYIYLKHRNEQVVAHAAEQLATLLRPHFGTDLLGPDRPVVSRVQLLHIRKLLVKIAPTLPTSGVRRTLWTARELLVKQEAYKGLVCYFDVDP